MKRAVLVSAAITIVLSPGSAMPTAFGATLPTPRHHHETIHHVPHSVAGEELTHPSAANGEAAHDPKVLGMGAKAGMPNAEWDCSNGDAGCSWHPEGWEGTRN